MASNIYTKPQVDNALLRAQVAMYLISKKIQDSFYYFNNPIYINYKDLQNDIYTLFIVLTYQEPFVTFDSTPTTFEGQYYNLVGSMINKTKQVDVFGVFGSTLNPNFQSTVSIVVDIVNNITASAIRIPFTSLTIVTLSNYQATYSVVYGNFPDISIWTDNGDGSYTQDTATVPTVVNLGGDINVPDSYTWTYAIPTSGYIQLNGFITAS